MDGMNQMPEHDRRRIGSALLKMLEELRQDPEAWAKVKARAAENRKEAKVKKAWN